VSTLAERPKRRKCSTATRVWGLREKPAFRWREVEVARQRRQELARVVAQRLEAPAELAEAADGVRALTGTGTAGHRRSRRYLSVRAGAARRLLGVPVAGCVSVRLGHLRGSR
jgi:hypothetical protein